jgi:hypothetical protein
MGIAARIGMRLERQVGLMGLMMTHLDVDQEPLHRDGSG